MNLNRSRLTTLAMVAVLVLLAFVGQQYSPLLLPKADLTAIAATGCDLQQQTCTATIPQGGRIQLSITPHPISFLQPLRVEVQVDGITPRKVEIDFAGANMDMGTNRNLLAAAGPGGYAGVASLPVCISGGMTWVATVIVETDRQRIAAPFHFHIQR